MQSHRENSLTKEYSIRVHKEYLNFAAAHFMIFADGEREPLHGHNYRVKVRLFSQQLFSDMVFDFLDLKPLVREVCQTLDHALLIPEKNPHLKIQQEGSHYLITTSREERFLFPQKDVLLLPILNTSAERLAIYIAHQIKELITKRFHFCFSQLEVEVEETPGQAATYTLQGEE